MGKQRSLCQLVLPVTSGLIFVALVYLQLHLNHTTYYKKKDRLYLYPKKEANQAFFERKEKKSISISNCDTCYLCSFSATMQWFVHEKKISALQEKKKNPALKKKKKKKKKKS